MLPTGTSRWCLSVLRGGPGSTGRDWLLRSAYPSRRAVAGNPPVTLSLLETSGPVPTGALLR